MLPYTLYLEVGTGVEGLGRSVDKTLITRMEGLGRSVDKTHDRLIIVRSAYTESFVWLNQINCVPSFPHL